MTFERVFVLRKPTEKSMALLQFLADGLDQRQVGLMVGRSRDQVKKRLQNVRNAMGAETTVHAVMIAFRNGWIK